MMLVICLLLLAGLAATDPLGDDCLACMCYVSSDGCVMHDPPCKKTGDGEYDEVCGPWGITYWYWFDGGELLGDFYDCTADWTCNELTVRAYLDRYVNSDDATCETYARTHVGGPSGSTADYTLPYWEDVEECLLNGTMPLR